MDYADHVDLMRHNSFEDFLGWCKDEQKHLVLLTTKGAVAYTDAAYSKDDILLLGQESAGVPDAVHQIAEKRIVIPMSPAMRSLNIAVAASMVLGEALRQTNQFHELE